MKIAKSAALILSLILTLACALPAATAADAGSEIIGYSAALVTRKDLSKVSNIQEYWNDTLGVITDWKITNAADLVFFADLVKQKQTFEGLTVYLAADIDLSGVENFEPIGGWTSNTWATPVFCGTFDGQGYAIQGMKMILPISSDAQPIAPDRGYVGFFRLLGAGAEIRNLVFDENCVVSGGDNTNVGPMGVLCGGIDSNLKTATTEKDTVVISNVMSKATFIHDGGVSGIIAPYAKAAWVTIDHVTTAGEMKLIDNPVGYNFNASVGCGGFIGFIGETPNDIPVSVTITNSRNACDVSGLNNAAGGFVGTFYEDADRELIIDHCINNGDVTTTVNKTAGKVSDSTKRAKYGFGFAGFVGCNGLKVSGGNGVSVKDCVNYGFAVAPAEKLDDSIEPMTAAIVNNGPGAQEAVVTNCTDAAGSTDASLAEALAQDTVKIEDPATEAPTEAPTAAPTDAPTEAPTDAPTEAPTDAPTDAPTEISSEAPTEAPTDAPATQPAGEKKGCKSFAACGLGMILLLGTACAIRKKID